ncbi:MAG: histidine triad nucleotide-binding protein [Emcibacteraceae bacterium]|nr:histidine triad nucleotide-binding protein [Emcibacteraceae bacterium]
MAYDQNNIFAMILRGDIPCDKVYEDEFALSFKDINPQAPVHTLVIPKGEFLSMADFTSNASAELVAGFFRAVGETARKLNLEEDGYRLIANTGDNAHQEVPHLHFHILSGKKLGPMLSM